MDPELQALAIRLGEVALRNTATTVAGRVSAALERRRSEERIAELQEIIDELQNDRSELLQIARSFEEEMVAQRISENDIDYISTTLIPKVERLLSMSGVASQPAEPPAAENADPVEQSAEFDQIVEMVRELLSPETIRILQVLGFNFRRAIGEPLTRLVEANISSREPSVDNSERVSRREELLFQIALDPDATERLYTLLGRP